MSKRTFNTEVTRNNHGITHLINQKKKKPSFTVQITKKVLHKYKSPQH